MAKELQKVYDPREVEGRIYQMWMDKGCFKGEIPAVFFAAFAIPAGL